MGKSETSRVAPHTVVTKHIACAKNASVELVTVDDGGHTWPGSSYDFSTRGPLGKTTDEISANAMIARFFAEHPMPDAKVSRPLLEQVERQRHSIDSIASNVPSRL